MSAVPGILFTLIAFAANSILCRLALGNGLIDPVTFTSIRLLSGAAILIPLAKVFPETSQAVAVKSRWISALALFIYALAFSLAYISLDAGTGALILFGAVQTTMIGSGLIAGERPSIGQWLGLTAALAGIVYLVFPGITAPDPLGAGLMFTAGVAWGVYSIRGKGEKYPVFSTAVNFASSVPLALAASAVTITSIHLDQQGVLLAVVSGAVTSGLGYVLWYRALRHISTTQAAIVQLLVPVLAAFGGVIFLSEVISVRLLTASVLILGGVGAAVYNQTPANGSVLLVSSKE